MGGRRRTLSVRGVGLAVAFAMTTVGCAGSGAAIDVPNATVLPTTIAATTNEATTESTTSSTAVSTPTSVDEPDASQGATNAPSEADPPASTSPPSTAPPVPTEPPPPTPPPTLADPFLRIGDEGDRVALMQRELVTLGYLGAGYTEGVFDRATADALIDFQAQYGLVVDGIFGPETDRSLSAAAASVDPES